MKKRLQSRSILTDQQGAIAIIIGITLIVLLGFFALAVDGGYVWVAQNELQNAADAGALAGARFLINPDGTINTNANQIAHDAATSNDSTNIPVEVNWSGGNTGDVQRGHWSFTSRTFTPNDNTAKTDLWFRTQEELDADLNFINAVRVVTRRESQPVNMFLAGLFGHDTMEVATDAVAYIGFAGNTTAIDAPIAICKQAIIQDNGEPICNVARRINSGSNVETQQTAGWTNLQQEPDFPDPCQGGTNAEEVSGLVCTGNTYTLRVGVPVGTTGGEVSSAFKKLRNCWQDATSESKSWPLFLPVIDCDSNNVTACEYLVGMVRVEVLWITGEGQDPNANDAPYQMEDEDFNSWSCRPETDSPLCIDGHYRWESFRDHYNLLNLDGSPAPYDNKTIYFKPVCDFQEPKGVTGGENFGIRAEIPVLVE